jgi:hypothetical protein
LDGNIAKWREEKEAMEKENVALMISLQELQVNQQKGKEKEIHQQKQIEDLEVQSVVLQKEKTMALNAIVVEKHGEPTLMVLQKEFEY